LPKAGLFGYTLNVLEAALQTRSGLTLEPVMVISRALEGTANMRDSAAALQRQVAAGWAEIERLRNDLSRARFKNGRRHLWPHDGRSRRVSVSLFSHLLVALHQTKKSPNRKSRTILTQYVTGLSSRSTVENRPFTYPD
jgi:hypothetical protein